MSSFNQFSQYQTPETRCCCGGQAKNSENETIKCQLCLKYSHRKCYGLPKRSNDPKSQSADENFRCIFCFAEMYEPRFEVSGIIFLKMVSSGTLINEESTTIDFSLSDRVIKAMGPKSQILFFFINMGNGKNFLENEKIDILVNETICKREKDFGAKSAVYITKLIRKERKNTIKVKSNNIRLNGHFIMLVCSANPNVKQVLMKKIMKRASFLVPKQSIKKFQEQNQEAMGQELLFCNPQVPIYDPTTLQKLNIPARGKDCTHVDCFSLEYFLKINKVFGASKRWTCPICKIPVFWPDIYFDESFLNVINVISNFNPFPIESSFFLPSFCVVVGVY